MIPTRFSGDRVLEGGLEKLLKLELCGEHASEIGPTLLMLLVLLSTVVITKELVPLVEELELKSFSDEFKTPFCTVFGCNNIELVASSGKPCVPDGRILCG